MIKSVKEIGELVLKREGKDLLNVLIDNPNPLGKYPYVICIELKQKGDDLKFSDVVMEEFEEGKIGKYLYKRIGGFGPDLSPTSRVGREIEVTLQRKILGWFRMVSKKDIMLLDRERLFLERIRNELLSNYNNILSKILNYQNDLPKNKSFTITLKIVENDKKMYIGDIPLFRKLVLELSKPKKDMSIASTDKVCSVCGKGGKLVFGNVSVYKFYTIDKKGFISGGFVKSNAWKNYPVCEECKIYLEEGKKFIEKNLSFRFYGLNYHLVPDFILGVGDTPSRVLEIFEDASSLISLREGSIKRLTDDEEEILGLLAKEEDYVALNLLFLRKMKQAERIILLIEEVLPSRLRKIFIAKDFVDEIFGENFNFGKIRQFFPKKDNENPDLNKYFLEITDRIFRSNMIDCRFVLSAVIKKIRDMFVNGEKFRNQVIDGLMVFLFLEKLSLVCFEEVSMEESYFESIFSRYKPVFQMPAKRGIFLLGCLTELLLRKQYAERQTKPPFIKNLKGLRMDERDIKSLLPKVQNKLEEYDSFDKGKKMVSQEVSRYLLAAGDNWRLSCDEINFYFVCGMNLADEVNSLLYER